MPPLPRLAVEKPDAYDLYRRVLRQLNAVRVPYLVGGAYFLEWVTGIGHRNHDLDVFVRHRDCESVLAALRDLGCSTETPFPHWLAKAHWEDQVIDVIFGTGNGQISVDDSWFEHALEGQFLGLPVLFCPVEETIWIKAFIMERERYDGADVAHLLQACAQRLDWGRLLLRFGDDWPVLLSHLILFSFIYPSERHHVPAWVMRALTARTMDDWKANAEAPRLCRGSLLSRAQYATDIEDWHYRDARVLPLGRMTSEAATAWSDAATDTPRVRR